MLIKRYRCHLGSCTTEKMKQLANSLATKGKPSMDNRYKLRITTTLEWTTALK